MRQFWFTRLDQCLQTPYAADCTVRGAMNYKASNELAELEKRLWAVDTNKQ
jgi:hypothetical protein